MSQPEQCVNPNYPDLITSANTDFTSVVDGGSGRDASGRSRYWTKPPLPPVWRMWT
jgi:hypothetical protein